MDGPWSLNKAKQEVGRNPLFLFERKPTRQNITRTKREPYSKPSTSWCFKVHDGKVVPVVRSAFSLLVVTAAITLPAQLPPESGLENSKRQMSAAHSRAVELTPAERLLKVHSVVLAWFIIFKPLREGRRFDSRPEALLCGACMFSLCPCGFSPRSTA